MSAPARPAGIDVFAPPVVKRSTLLDRDRSAEFAWLRAHAKEYAGQWVALDGGKLLGSGFLLRDVLDRLSAAERASNPLFHRVDID